MADKQISISHSEALEIVARQFGLDTWNILSARIESAQAAEAGDAMVFGRAMPIVRIFDIPKAHEFYLSFLGFQIDWEHRFHDNAPLYMQVTRSGLSLHLSEHAGDASPGGNMVVYMPSGLKAFHAELLARNYRSMRPGLTQEDWGLEMVVVDPFSNPIRFMERNSG